MRAVPAISALRGAQQPLPAAGGQEALPGRLAGRAEGWQRVPGEQRPQEALQALQQLPPALLPVGQRWVRLPRAEGLRRDELVVGFSDPGSVGIMRDPGSAQRWLMLS